MPSLRKHSRRLSVPGNSKLFVKFARMSSSSRVQVSALLLAYEPRCAPIAGPVVASACIIFPPTGLLLASACIILYRAPHAFQDTLVTGHKINIIPGRNTMHANTTQAIKENALAHTHARAHIHNDSNVKHLLLSFSWRPCSFNNTRQ